MYEKLIHEIAAACKDVFNAEVTPVVSRPDEQFGDYACNVALQLAKQLDKNPREIAEQLVDKVQQIDGVAEVNIAGPGFLNISLAAPTLIQEAFIIQPYQHHEGKQVLVEFGNFNPLKTVHLGHLYQTIVSSAIARLFERSGAVVHPISYHGDVGMHIAKAIWAIGEDVNWDPEKLKGLNNSEESDDSMQNLKALFGSYYAQGSEAYENDPDAAEQIREVNRQVYDRDNIAVNKIHELCVKRSLAYFDTIYDELGVTFERHFLESETAPIGTKVVKDNIGKVFEVADLKELDLPFVNQEIIPSAAHEQYEDERVQAWSKKVKAADGYILVTPEYNHGPPASLKNAVDWLYGEWHNKPAAIVSYGSMGGARAAEQLKLNILRVKLFPTAAVPIPDVWSDVKDGVVVNERAEENVIKAVDALKSFSINT